MHTSLNEKAEENLRYIRAAMESAIEFTGVSGKGYVIAGLSALFASVIAAAQSSPDAWIAVWMLELVVAACAALVFTAHKARRQGGSLFSASGKKLLLAFIPTMCAGAILTLAFYLSQLVHLLPGIWLTLYGAAVITAGAHSVRVIPLMGSGFILLGCVALFTNVSADLLLGLGLGGFHIATGAIIWRYYGG